MNTPMTDAATITPRPVLVRDGMSWQPEIVYAEFARTLERKVNQLEADKRELVEALIAAEDRLCKGPVRGLVSSVITKHKEKS